MRKSRTGAAANNTHKRKDDLHVVVACPHCGEPVGVTIASQGDKREVPAYVHLVKSGAARLPGL